MHGIRNLSCNGIDTLPKDSYGHIIMRGKFLHDKVQIEVDKSPEGAKVKLGL
jgi:hypothetical protein|nr:hypothetical protein [Bacillus mycoides]